MPPAILIRRLPPLLLACLLPLRAAAGDRVTWAETEAGGLYLATEEAGMLEPAPEVAATVTIRISGPVARVEVRQRFRNPDAVWREALYSYPLPEASAVDTLEMTVGGRVTRGAIEEKAAALKRYDTARADGRRASLISQERPNIFTTEIANLGPGEEAEIHIGYDQTVPYRDGGFSLRFPMVIRPRYIPGTAVGPTPSSGRGWSQATDAVPDAPRITPPIDVAGGRNPVRLTIELEAGFPVGALASPSHDVAIERLGESRARITLAEGPVPADRDFLLHWRPASAPLPTAGFFREAAAGRDHWLLMLLPPTADAPSAARPREIIVVLDKSGSMGGAAIRQAKAAVGRALDRLRPGDRFNLIVFDHQARMMFTRSEPVSRGALDGAKAYLDHIDAGGGTEMAPALERALGGERDPERLRQIVFITDGAVGNEAALLRLIHERLGDARLFTVGISAAPNTHFMTEAAVAGRGTHVTIASADEVADRMADLFTKIEAPVLTDLELSWPGVEGLAVHPEPLPDLYAGAPLLLTLRTDSVSAPLVVAGRFGPGGRRWQRTVPIEHGISHAGIAALWARARIRTLERAGRRDPASDEEAVRSAILETALDYGLVSRVTALVAVEKTRARPRLAPLASQAVPVNLVSDMDPGLWPQAVFAGPPPAFLTPAQLDADAATRPRLRLDRSQRPEGSELTLPETDLGTDRKLRLGLSLLLLTLAALGAARVRERS